METKILSMKVKNRLKSHTGSKDPEKQVQHFEKDEKVEKELENTIDRTHRLIRKLRK
jgi:hypothetical protein